MSAAEIVNKVWNYAHVLRALQNPFGLHQVYTELRSDNDGVGYGDYVEQITYLIFLKMADERDKAGVPSPQSSPGGRGGNGVPKKFSWESLVKLDGDDLELQYRHTLESPVPLRGSIRRMIIRQNNFEKTEFTGR